METWKFVIILMCEKKTPYLYFYYYAKTRLDNHFKASNKYNYNLLQMMIRNCNTQN